MCAPTFLVLAVRVYQFRTGTLFPWPVYRMREFIRPWQTAESTNILVEFVKVDHRCLLLTFTCQNMTIIAPSISASRSETNAATLELLNQISSVNNPFIRTKAMILVIAACSRRAASIRLAMESRAVSSRCRADGRRGGRNADARAVAESRPRGCARARPVPACCRPHGIWDGSSLHLHHRFDFRRIAQAVTRKILAAAGL